MFYPVFLRILSLSILHKGVGFVLSETTLNEDNSLALGRCGSNFKSIIVKLIIQNRSLGTQSEIILRGMPQTFTNEMSILAQPKVMEPSHVVIWCH